jgi:hypothetical protein
MSVRSTTYSHVVFLSIANDLLHCVDCCWHTCKFWLVLDRPTYKQGGPRVSRCLKNRKARVKRVSWSLTLFVVAMWPEQLLCPSIYSPQFLNRASL